MHTAFFIIILEAGSIMQDFDFCSNQTKNTQSDQGLFRQNKIASNT